MNRALMISGVLATGGLVIIGGVVLVLLLKTPGDESPIVAMIDEDDRFALREFSNTRPGHESAPPSEPAAGGEGPQLRAGEEFNFTREFSLAGLDTTGLLIEPDDIHGGVGIDGIAALSRPRRDRASESHSLSDEARVIVVTRDDEIVAYPIPILNHHWIINDTVGESPVVITFCPASDSIVVFDRVFTIDDEEGNPERRALNFSVAGLMVNSNMLMYDRTFRCMWMQAGMQCISGPLAAERLRTLPFELSTLGEFRAAHPDAWVVSTSTGFAREYDVNPFASYLADSTTQLFPVRHVDDRLPNRTWGVGAIDRESGEAVFVPVAPVRAGGELRLEMRGGMLTIFARDSALSIETTGTVDAATMFWFVWAAFHPETRITTP